MRAPLDPARVKKILVIKLRHIGDVLLTVPVFRALKETFPAAHCTALVNAGTEEMLLGNPLVDAVLTFDRSIKREPLLRRYVREASFYRSVRARGFDMTVDLTSGDRPALLSFLSGARCRLAADPRGAGFPGKRHLYTHLTPVDSRQHTVLQNLDVVRPCGITTQDLSVDLFLPEEAKRFVRGLFAEHGIRASDTVVHVHPTSRWFFKCWRDEGMAEVIGWLVAQGIKTVVTSSPAQKEIDKTQRILSLVPLHAPPSALSHLVVLCGGTTLKQLGALSAAATLFFGVDSAPMHMAAAVGTPVVALFGPSGAPHWGPWDEQAPNAYLRRSGVQKTGRHTVLQSDRECVPCGRDGCNGSKTSDCLVSITAPDVEDALQEKIDAAPRRTGRPGCPV
ncbi:MAG: putative lipopolysaccharide heptosyltransferase III [Thermodesulfovibrionales bacterium]